MSERQRLHRKDPERTGPRRNGWSVFGQSATRASPESRREEPAREAAWAGQWNDVVARSVELGYRVVEENIRRGREVAEQLRGHPTGAPTIPHSLQQLSECTLRYAADLAAFWRDVVAAVAPGIDGNSSSPRRREPSPRSPSDGFGTAVGGAGPEAFTGSSPEGRTAVSVAITSLRPTRVTLELRPQSEGRRLDTHGLREVDAAIPPLDDVAFEPGGDDTDGSHGGICLRIRVPEEQPPGLYSGVVFDRDTGHPQGTLAVRLTE